MSKSVWIIDDDSSIRWVLEKALSKTELEVHSFGSAEEAAKKIQQNQPHAVLTDIRMPGMDGLEFLTLIKNRYPQLPVIIMTAYSDLDSAVSAFHGGAFEYLPKPFDINEAVEMVRRACQSTAGVKTENNRKQLDIAGIIGAAPAMQEVFRAIGRLARSNITVLITGESGTGKELVAHALHRHGAHADGPFIAINTAAIPRELLESELFGHERGAFTGATERRIGRFEQANGGTLFLDEIGDMPADLQTRLLRVLAEGDFYRVGGRQPVRVDVRIIAATHQQLDKLVAEHRFREDLYHRLNVVPIRLPALRERLEDIPALMQAFLHRAAKEMNESPKKLLPEAEECLMHWHWPGNVRQLENTARWLTVMATGNHIHFDDLPVEIRSSSEFSKPATELDTWKTRLDKWAKLELDKNERPLLETALPEFERTLIQATLAATNGHKQDAARRLGWGRNTLTRKMKELGMK